MFFFFSNLLWLHKILALFNAAELVDEDAFKLTDKLQTWLTNKELPPNYAAVLERHDYFELTFIAGLKIEVTKDKTLWVTI